MQALELNKCMKASQSQDLTRLPGDVIWSVDLHLGTRHGSAASQAVNHSGSKHLGDVRTTDGLMLQLWDCLDGHQGNDVLIEGVNGDVPEPFAVCVVVEQAYIKLQGAGTSIRDTEAKLHGEQLFPSLAFFHAELIAMFRVLLASFMNASWTSCRSHNFICIAICVVLPVWHGLCCIPLTSLGC
jgi:hypothetical protein